jgi:hypothetical protein
MRNRSGFGLFGQSNATVWVMYRRVKPFPEVRDAARPDARLLAPDAPRLQIFFNLAQRCSQGSLRECGLNLSDD